ncbi:hypothetical protein [Spirosoma panaciterrae]|uniref:hypothetical protein n=1 Tax=Spirosoma panaciterrae TaxID=496058 RepID=UPI0003754F1D|nr:hypothetical protein [Spirosoma panaciterrae]
MLTAIQGTYDHGQIILDEVPSIQKRMKVIVTFLEEEPEAKKKPRKAGSLAGRGSIPANFNEPLDDLSDYM